MAILTAKQLISNTCIDMGGVFQVGTKGKSSPLVTEEEWGQRIALLESRFLPTNGRSPNAVVMSNGVRVFWDTDTSVFDAGSPTHRGVGLVKKIVDGGTPAARTSAVGKRFRQLLECRKPADRSWTLNTIA